MIAAIIPIASPGVAITTVATLVGLALFLIRGLGEIFVFAWRLRGMHKRVVTA